MKIEELAALVAVRNHIFTVINDKSVTGREDFRPLEAKRRELDLKFIQAIRDNNVDDLFTNEITIVKIGDPKRQPTPVDREVWRDMFEQIKSEPKPNFTIFTHDAVDVSRVNASSVEVKQKQLELSFPNGTNEQSIEKQISEAIPEKVEEEGFFPVTPDVKLVVEEKLRAEAARQASKDPDIASAIAKQKAELKKQGRSNKKVVKSNGTTG